ncbi:hypothetical protein CR513_06475, partial [Mucuna pruriens]
MIRVSFKTIGLWSWQSLCIFVVHRIKTLLWHLYVTLESLKISSRSTILNLGNLSLNVNLNKVGYKGKPFIMASQVKKVVGGSPRKKLDGSDGNQDTCLDISNAPSFSTCMHTFNDKNEVDDVHFTRHYHIESLWNNINITHYKSYVMILARSKVGILYGDWDHVEEIMKNMI